MLGKWALALLGAAALAAVAIGYAEGHGAKAGRLRAPCARSDVFVFAHEDDALLFMMPSLGNDIAAGDCVRLVDLTAGDSGLGAAYWQGRELGLRTALAYVAHESSTWAEHDAGIPGHPASAWRLGGNPKLSVVFLNLPDGRSDGTGFAADGDQSLYKLWYSDIPTMTSVDGLATYSRDDLIATIGILINRAKATFVGTQDYDAPFTIVPNHDHYDHIAGALFSDQAIELHARNVTLVRYQDYSIVDLPPNLKPSQATQKAGAFRAYLPYDPMVQPACPTSSDCAKSIYGLEALRQYSAPEPKPYPSG